MELSRPTETTTTGTKRARDKKTDDEEQRTKRSRDEKTEQTSTMLRLVLWNVKWGHNPGPFKWHKLTSIRSEGLFDNIDLASQHLRDWAMRHDEESKQALSDEIEASFGQSCETSGCPKSGHIHNSDREQCRKRLQARFEPLITFGDCHKSIRKALQSKETMPFNHVFLECSELSVNGSL